MPSVEEYRPDYGQPMLVEGDPWRGLRPVLSFPATIKHKLLVISRASGGLGKAAKRIGVNRFTLRRWLDFAFVPTRSNFISIDQQYDIAWEQLRVEANTSKAKRHLREARNSVDRQPGGGYAGPNEGNQQTEEVAGHPATPGALHTMRRRAFTHQESWG